jgi:hypothetical protein
MKAASNFTVRDDCPPEYGPSTTIYNRFVRWASPTATAFQHMHDAADDTPIVRSFDPSHIGPDEARSASIAHRSARKGSCASSRSPQRKQIRMESGLSRRSSKINEF